VTLEELQDAQTKRVRVRMVDVTTESYRVARNYMTRLERDDLREPYLSRLAAHTNLSASAFRDRFHDVIEEARPHA
jgi:6-phosphofructokinase 1